MYLFVFYVGLMGLLLQFVVNMVIRLGKYKSHDPCSQVNICWKILTATAVCKFGIKNMIFYVETNGQLSRSSYMHQMRLESQNV